MEKGTLVEFRRQGDSDSLWQSRVGLLERPEGKKNWVVVDAKGHSHTIHPRQMTYVVEGERYEPKELAEFFAAVESVYDPDSLEVAWELLVEDKQATTPAEMAMLLFSDQEPPFCYAAHRLLSEDKLYFKQKGDVYEPRSASQVEELRHQVEKQAQRLQEQEAFQASLRKAVAGEDVEWKSCDRIHLQSLEKFALMGESASTRADAIEILSAVKRQGSPEAALQLLVDLRLWTPHENLFLRRSQISTEFSTPVQATVAERLSHMPPDPDPTRTDLTHLKVYTIDDEGTREIDDGLSLETLSNGRQRLWIHIADPSRWILLGDELDQEAKRRGTTIYLPTGMIPMFPAELSTGPMSLVQGAVCCALSFGVTLTEEGGIDSYEICPSQVRPTYRLTYEDVDEMLDLAVQAEPELLSLAKWSKCRQDWRRRQGAININLPESSIKVEGDQIRIEVLDDSEARTLVAEMMILTGEVAASYGETHNLPLPFRGQPQPELPPEEELDQLPSEWVRACAIRGCMTRSEVGTTPIRHASLGLDSYCQVTSPIRRYADLLAHFQIKAHLRGDPLPFSDVELSPLIVSVTTTAQEATLIERQTNRYWCLEYLRQHADAIWQAEVLRWLREHENLALVLLEDLGVELAVRLDFSAALGDRLEVKVSSVDPRLDRIKLKAYASSTETSAPS
ncbi:MAG: ribonuclease R family protein [Cyanobacteria bacterium P01_A01_bin.17]